MDSVSPMSPADGSGEVIAPKKPPPRRKFSKTVKIPKRHLDAKLSSIGLTPSKFERNSNATDSVDMTPGPATVTMAKNQSAPSGKRPSHTSSKRILTKISSQFLLKKLLNPSSNALGKPSFKNRR